MKQIIPTYTFSASAKTVTFTDLDSISLERILLITNTTKNVILYNFADPTKGGTVATNVLTLATSTTGMADTDKLNIVYDMDKRDVTYEKTVVGNQRTFFKDGINTSIQQPDSTIWALTNDSANHIVNTGGNSAGSAYIRISLDPFTEDSGVTLIAKKQFQMPYRASFGISSSQRGNQTELFYGLLGSDASGNITTISTVADKTLPAQTVTIASNIATINLPAHGFVAGDRVSIFNLTTATSSNIYNLNISAANIVVVDANNFTVPTGLASATVVITSGTVRLLDPLYYAKNGSGYAMDTSTTTAANLTTRRDGAKYRRLTNQTVSTITSTQTISDPYSDALNSGSNFEIVATNDEVQFRNFSSDSTAGVSGIAKLTQATPDDSISYKPYIRARNLPGMSKPIGRITAISKTGTTTATITTDVAHTLVTGDIVGVYGVPNTTDFPASSAYVVASVPSSTQITVVMGATTPTISSAGGFITKTSNNQAVLGASTIAIQSISRTSNVMFVTGGTTWSGFVSGDYINLYGLNGTGAAAYEGAYKVLRINGTSLELLSTGSDFTSITTGGGLIRRTDVRIHYVRMTDFTRNITEVYGGRGNASDSNNAVPVSMTSAFGVSQSTGVNTTQWSAAGWGGVLVNDIVSAAITTSTTSTAITPASIANIGTYAHSFSVSVSAITGTTPTMDVGVEESPDNGTTWVRIYDFPRITATGVYYSPQISATWGTRYRYVRTVTGTTPSISHAINRIQFSTVPPFIREFQDRTIVPTTLNSTTPTYFVDGCKNISLVVYAGTITTTAAAYQLEGSETGTEWYSIGSAVTPATTVTSVTFNANTTPKFVRVRVSSAGVAITGHYVAIKALGN
jgi:hypothetical protein